MLWPLFARAQRHWFLENCLLSAPGVQSVFFLLRSVGPEQKKTHHPGCFFCSGPGEKQDKEKPRAGTGPQQKINTLGGVFFFLLWPRAGTGLLLPLPFPGAGAKKQQPGWCFFFCCGPARTLTHSLRAWVAMPPLAGVVFFFAAAPPGPGWCFFFFARMLTHSLWAGAISARPGWCFFFLLRPRRVFLDNNKKCLGYYIGSKNTRRGHSEKKNITSTQSASPKP